MIIANEASLMAALLDKSQRREAFGKIVSLHSEKLYWQIRRMVIGHDDTNDVLQNTFLKAWNNLDSFRGESKLSTWLYKIAINESLTFLSKQNNNQTSSLDDESALLAGKLESDTFIDGNELELKLQRAILTLPEKQRLVFNLRYYDEMKYDEMSNLLGTSVGALKASYHHAAKKIEEFLLTED